MTPMEDATPIRILMVEDSSDDAELIRLELERGSFRVAHERVDSREDLEHALEGPPFDVVICDYAMPRFDGLSAFALVQERAPELPLIFVSGVLGEDRAVEAMRAGAYDYVLKDNLGRLVPAVRRAVRETQSRRERREAERALAIEERRYRSIFETAAVSLWELDLSPLASWRGGEPPPADRLRRLAGAVRVLDVNDAATRLAGATSKQQLLGELRDGFSGDALVPWVEACRSTLRGDEMFEYECPLHRLDGSEVPVLFCMRVAQSRADLSNVVVCMIDLTARRRLEQQIHASQRMEAIGRLAGGIAHDFNNFLTVIQGFAETLLSNCALDESGRQDVGVIQEAGERAAALTSQLLAFGRKQARQVETVNLNAVVQELERMLRRVIGEDIQLETSLSHGMALVDADPSQLEQIVMNLAVNARDAMASGGTLRIETSSERLDSAACGRLDTDLVPGPYIRLSLSDTGEGMDRQTQELIFEPFFTTKEKGRGTGLGLATTYGIVKQNGGHIAVASQLGQGTRFDIWLPASADQRVRPREPAPTSNDLDGSETVLLVEDEELVRRTATRVLRRRGYQVLVADGGARACELCDRHDGPIDVLITDLVMPQRSGRWVVEQIVARRPGIAIVYMSGYSDDTIAQHGVLEPGTYLSKPFGPEQLLASLREALARAGGAGRVMSPPVETR